MPAQGSPDLSLAPQQIWTPQPPTPEPTGTVAMTDPQYLRVLLQEVVPIDGQETDTLFLEQHIVEFLNRAAGLLSTAAAVGWRVKAGALSAMVDRNDGLSQKKLSQASAAAQKIAKMWQEQADQDSVAFALAVRPAGMPSKVYDQTPFNLYNQLWDVSHIDRYFLPWNVIEG